MHFRKKKKDEDMDPTTKKLLDQGLIRIKTTEEEEGAVQKLKEIGAVTFDFWSGVKYIIVLSALLWWLPLFGPMLAGYVGGRRTGGPKKGLIASIIGLVLIGIVHLAITRNVLPTQIMGLMALPGALVTAAYEVPVLAAYIPFLEMYWTSFFTSVIGGLPYSSNSYVITAIFAYIGGVIAVDKEREVSRALNKKEPKVTIDMSKTFPNTPILPVQRGWSSSNARPKKAFDSAERKEMRNQRHLQDLKKIQFEKPRKNYERPSTNVQSRSFRNLSNRETQKDRRDAPQVRHHGIPEGDDWEIL